MGPKRVAYPVAAWGLARFALDLTPPLVHAAVPLAALPTGMRPFMLAELCHREADVAARVGLVATVLSILTMSDLVAAIR